LKVRTFNKYRNGLIDNCPPNGRASSDMQLTPLLSCSISPYH